MPLASLQLHPGRIPIGTMPTARRRAEKADSGQPQGAMNACNEDDTGSSEETPLLSPALQLEQPTPRPTTSNMSRDAIMKKLWASEEGRAGVLSLASEKPERTLKRGALGVSGLSASLPEDPTRALAVLCLLNSKFGIDVCVSF